MEEDTHFKNLKNGFSHSILLNELEKLCQKSPFQNHWSLLYMCLETFQIRTANSVPTFHLNADPDPF
jgi:hypothetical protein